MNETTTKIVTVTVVTNVGGEGGSKKRLFTPKKCAFHKGAKRKTEQINLLSILQNLGSDLSRIQKKCCYRHNTTLVPHFSLFYCVSTSLFRARFLHFVELGTLEPEGTLGAMSYRVLGFIQKKSMLATSTSNWLLNVSDMTMFDVHQPSQNSPNGLFVWLVWGFFGFSYIYVFRV